MYGWRARIGNISPTACAEILPYEFYRVASEGVTFVSTNLVIRDARNPASRLGVGLDSFLDRRPNSEYLRGIRHKTMTFLLLFKNLSHIIIRLTLRYTFDSGHESSY